jgi:hypothetical protein
VGAAVAAVVAGDSEALEAERRHRLDLVEARVRFEYPALSGPLLINVIRKLASPRGAEPNRQATASRKPRAQRQCLRQK